VIDDEPSPRTEEPILITQSMLEPETEPKTEPERIDFERGMRTAPPLVIALIAANIAVFVWEAITGALDDRASLIAAGALVRERVLHGEVWRIVTATFLHGSVSHLLGNCVMLYIVGMALEHAVGQAQSAFVYFASGIAGSLFSLLLTEGPSVGASGAIFGVIGAVVVILYQHRDRYHLRDNRVGLVLAVYAAYAVITGLASPLIDNSAHVGGFLGGALAGYFVKPTLLRAPLTVARRGR
jgi:rhomboid protease GluP